jgi:hypothetical protein
MTRLSTRSAPPAPQHRRTRHGAAVRVHLGDLVYPGHSLFASPDVGRRRPAAHPDVHGITRRPAEKARMIAELGNGRLEYSYQPQVPLLTMPLQLDRVASPRPSPTCVSHAFLAADPGTVREWKQQGYKNFFRLLLRLDPAIRTAASPARSARSSAAPRRSLSADQVTQPLRRGRTSVAPEASYTRSSGSSAPAARHAAVCGLIVWSLFCRVLGTRASIAALSSAFLLLRYRERPASPERAARA